VVSRFLRASSGQPLQWPTADDTGNVGAILAENTAAPTQDITFGTKTLSAFMYTSKMVKVSYQLLNDSAFDLGAWLPDKFAQRIGRAINAHFTNGTGGGTQPTGMIPNLTTGKVGATGQTLTVTYDDIIDLIHSIDPAYRNGGGSFMMADSTLKAVRKLKDTQGRPLWEPSLQQNTPSSLVGYPILINQDMPVMAANAKSIAFGNFREAYVIRQVQGVQLKRFDERFADALQVGFLSFARYDGTTDDLNAAKLYVNSAT
jgi:HK97 family phage major capsid protein